jgi:poly(A) polymerase
VLNRLSGAGFQAYLVGGSIRDLLLKQSPKDFDVATDAKPAEIKGLFRNARIIGRRFKLVHILYHREIIEVATFRSNDAVNSNHKKNEKGMLIQDNVYGTFEDDAWRRDFTINSLYYNIEDGSIIDFTGGVNDINSRIIRIIGDASTRYEEDPVRMLRAIRFSARLHFDLDKDTAEPILKLNHLIAHVSGSRLFEEMIKLYQCGESEIVQQLLVKYGLFSHLYPQTFKMLDSKYPVNSLLVFALESTDTRIKQGKPINPAFLYAILLWFPLIERIKVLRKKDIEPLLAIEQAMAYVISEQNKVITVPKRHTQIMREIWMLQYRFPKRAGKRAQNLLQHPRFRAGYDFLALRALAGDESMDLANWWTTFQEVDENTKEKMSAKFSMKS